MKHKVIVNYGIIVKNPTMCDGDRNHYCPYYSDCLDVTVNKQWDRWSCSNCDFKDINIIDIMRRIEQKKSIMMDPRWIKELTEELQPYF